EVEELALEAARHLAPVASHGFEPDDLERAVDQPRVALLAARCAAAHLGQEEAGVDLLELELEMALAPELAGEPGRHLGADPVTQLPRPPGRTDRVRLVEVDEDRVRVTVDDTEAAALDGLRREADHVLAREGDRVRDRRGGEPRRRRGPAPGERGHEELGRPR